MARGLPVAAAFRVRGITSDRPAMPYVRLAGTDGASDEVVIAVHASGDALRRWWRDVRPAADFDCDYCAPWLQRLSVWICRDPHRPLREIWPELRQFI